MTPQRLNEIIDLMAWDSSTLADILGTRSDSVRRWRRGREPIPDAIAAWLERLAAVMADIPPKPAIKERETA